MGILGGKNSPRGESKQVKGKEGTKKRSRSEERREQEKLNRQAQRAAEGRSYHGE